MDEASAAGTTELPQAEMDDDAVTQADDVGKEGPGSEAPSATLEDILKEIKNAKGPVLETARRKLEADLNFFDKAGKVFCDKAAAMMLGVAPDAADSAYTAHPLVVGALRSALQAAFASGVDCARAQHAKMMIESLTGRGK